MTRYRFSSEALPWKRIATAVVMVVLILDLILTTLVAWLVARGGAP